MFRFNVLLGNDLGLYFPHLAQPKQGFVTNLGVGGTSEAKSALCEITIAQHCVF